MHLQRAAAAVLTVAAAAAVLTVAAAAASGGVVDATLPAALRALLPAGTQWVSALGDPGLAAEPPPVLVVGWNFCNGAAAPPQYPTHPSPRWADCGAGVVSAADNALGPGDPFPAPGFNATSDANEYAIQKELFLGAACSRPAAVPAGAPAWNYSYHVVMLKTGNMDIAAGLCPETAPAPPPPHPPRLGFNNLSMNQPLLELTPAAVRRVPYGGTGYVGSLGATYDVNASWTPAEADAVRAALANYTAAWVDYRFAEVDGVSPLPPSPDGAPPALLANKSYEGVVWWRNVSSGSTVFHHIQKSSPAAPWLMSYYKLMDATGVGGGYDWPGAGQMRGPVPSYASRLRVQYNQLTTTNLYVPCHGGCWKLDGAPCDGDIFTDITRYVCFLVNSGPGPSGGCSPKNEAGCPLFHVRSSDGKRIYRNNTAEFPHACYSQHCGPGGNGVGGCDPYSNPGPQELMMLQPCAEWGIHGYPTVPGGGAGALLDLDFGGLGARLALVGEEPADVGPAARAAAGWAPLPPLSSLPPYPGWTRSWVGVDFGAEQFAPASNRYEFTAVDMLVAAA